MSFYHKGNPHKIAAMASKSCNAVSSRDLYVPLNATVTVNSEARTFQVKVVATCYFGTRINIENNCMQIANGFKTLFWKKIALFETKNLTN